MTNNKKLDTNITAEHKRMFTALRDPSYDNFALFSAFVNGEPTAVIVAMTGKGDDIEITPMFVAVTPGMKIIDHEGKEPSHE